MRFFIHFRRRFALTPCSSASRDKTVLRCRVVAASPVPTDKPHPQFLIIVFHHKVSTYFGGHLMHQRTQQQKVPRNSRLRCIELFGVHQRSEEKDNC